ncbi:hypothetical protein GGS24DRAFT_498752 [Hypoxylon argillaceum]|nr:hypothetical protein GGS24DRAFT_498752 [Hypoxylon argillaceum]
MSSIRRLPLLHVTRARPSHPPSSHHLRLSPSLSLSLSPITPRHHPSALHHGRRSFHWQSTLGTAIEGAQSLMVSTHAVTGLPWFLTLPLVAFTVGLTFRLPFMFYSQHVVQRRLGLLPLMQAWSVRVYQDVTREGVPVARHLPERKKRLHHAARRIHRKLGLQSWRMFSGILGFPFWLLALDAVRRLCGGPRGLLGTLIIGSAAPTATAESTTTAGSIADPSALPMDPAVLTSAVDPATLLDPSLTFEGCLWFTDLTAADPYHILPLALSCTLVWNLQPPSTARWRFSDQVRTALGRPSRPGTAQSQVFGAASDEKPSLRERGPAIMHVGMVAVAALIGPLTMDMPAALHLYWLASSATNAMFSRGLRHFMPKSTQLRKSCSGGEAPYIRPLRATKN